MEALERNTILGQEPIVFVVDEDHLVRRALARLIRSMGLAAMAFSSAEEFLEFEHDGGGPACIVVDVRMPAMNGLDLRRSLKAAGINLPIVLVSSQADDSSWWSILKCEDVTRLEKPIDYGDLLGGIQEALRVGR